MSLDRPCTWLCNERTVLLSTEYGFPICSRKCLASYESNKCKNYPPWLMHCSLMRQAFIDRIARGKHSHYYSMIRKELRQRHEQFGTQLGRVLSIHTRRSMKLLDRVDNETRYDIWYSHGIGELTKLIGNYKLVKTYMKLTYDEILAISKGEPHDHIYECITKVIIQMAQCWVNEGTSFINDYEDCVNKLVSSW